MLEFGQKLNDLQLIVNAASHLAAQSDGNLISANLMSFLLMEAFDRNKS